MYLTVKSLRAADLDLDTRLNPQAQPGAEIYAAMHTKLDEAITALGSNPGAPMISSTVVMPLSGLKLQIH